ncbi:MAG: hypothetical protein KJP00_08560, partial [Bacteroidia bacterium]|nr:hypothetical protein [Bacteroidia bacterium]
MNRLLLPLLLLASLQLFGQENQDIFLDVPNRFNNTLLNHSIAQEAKQKDIVDALLKDIKRSSRKNDDDPLQETSHVQSGKSIAICLDTTNIAGNFGVVNDLMCSALQFGSITISDNCITYTSIAGVPVGRDTMCVDLCDRDNGCTQYIFPLEVRNSMPLPFLEDFATSEVLPNEAIWQNNDVFINKTMGINPPSIGIATFDGIDKNGRPYYG